MHIEVINQGNIIRQYSLSHIMFSHRLLPVLFNIPINRVRSINY